MIATAATPGTTTPSSKNISAYLLYRGFDYAYSKAEIGPALDNSRAPAPRWRREALQVRLSQFETSSDSSFTTDPSARRDAYVLFTTAIETLTGASR